MRRLSPPLEEYLNDAGMLSAVFGAFDVIWRPPSVEVGLSAPSPFAPQDSGETPTLLYPVPEEWHSPYDLEAVGWQRQEETESMLNSFLGLAQDARPQKVGDKVRAFAERFGPLWLCRAHYHCHWSGPHGRHETNPCRWVPMEEVSAFVQEAHCVEAVLEIATLVQGKKPVLSRLAEPLGLLFDQVSPQEQRMLLTWVVNERLIVLRGAQLRLAWHQSEKPTLDIVNGLGFLPHVWLEVAQRVCNVLCIPQCTGCGKRYSRTKKKPQSGQGNYCERCGSNKAKSDSKARRQALECRARQLYAEGISINDIVQQFKLDAGRIKIDHERVQKWISSEGTMAHELR